MLSINPDAATRDDVARLAAELMDANHERDALKAKLEAIHDALDEMHAEFKKDLAHQRAEPWIPCIKRIMRILDRRDA